MVKITEGIIKSFLMAGYPAKRDFIPKTEITLLSGADMTYIVLFVYYNVHCCLGIILNIEPFYHKTIQQGTLNLHNLIRFLSSAPLVLPAVTVRIVFPEMLPDVTVMVVVPAATEVASLHAPFKTILMNHQALHFHFSVFHDHHSIQVGPTVTDGIGSVESTTYGDCFCQSERQILRELKLG